MPARLRALVHRDAIADEIREELHDHLDSRTEHVEREGKPSRLSWGVMVVVAVVLVTPGCLAAWLPARRAAHLDPVRALRAE